MYFLLGQVPSGIGANEKDKKLKGLEFPYWQGSCMLSAERYFTRRGVPT